MKILRNIKINMAKNTYKVVSKVPKTKIDNESNINSTFFSSSSSSTDFQSIRSILQGLYGLKSKKASR